MTQATTAHPREGRHMSWQQKSAALSLVIIGSAGAYYVANMWPMRPIALATDTIPAGYGGLVLSTVALIIGAQIALQAVLAVSAGAVPPAAERDRQAAWRATRNAYGVLVFGVMAAVGSVFLEELTPFCTANIAILGLILAELVKYGSMLLDGRRPVSPAGGSTPEAAT